MREPAVPTPEAAEYRCPGEAYSISRSVHLARLATFYSACRDCPHAADTGTLAPNIVKRLTAARVENAPSALFGDDDRARLRLDDAACPRVRRLAAALGVYLQRERTDRARTAMVVLAADGRSQTADLVAEAADGLRWSGCDVVDVGAAAAPAVAHAIAHRQADGGLRLGVEGIASAEATLAFWSADAEPLSSGIGLDLIRDIHADALDRPTRRYGRLQRFETGGLYLDGVSELFHALRPLRFVLDTPCQTLVAALAMLTAASACEIIPLGLPTTDESRGEILIDGESATESGADRPKRSKRRAPLPRPAVRAPGSREDPTQRRQKALEHRVRSERAHFGLAIDPAGETIRLVDELGRTVGGDTFLAALTRRLIDEQSNGRTTVALEKGSAAAAVAALEAAGARVVVGAPAPQSLHQLARRHDALAAGGPSGRIWLRRAAIAPDALAALGLWLTVLSETDRGASRVLADALAQPSGGG